MPYKTDFAQGDDANDQHIINFSLVLEFLEVEFYRLRIRGPGVVQSADRAG